MITLDTSGLVALVDRRDVNHARAVEVLKEDRGPYLVPAGILLEVAHLLGTRLGPEPVDRFLADLESRAFALDCPNGDLPRIRYLLRRYADLRLGLADASVIACAERSGGRVMTFDLGDFGVVAREKTIPVLPALAERVAVALNAGSSV